ncbi:MAG: DegT/DnrJ/EryC1/StrS family aminotransferase [Bryobacteraceae bacterium]
MTRRGFLGAAAAAGALGAEKPAVLGGNKMHPGPWPKWPVIDDTDRKALAAVLESGGWYRGYGKNVDKFEAAYQQLTGAKYCLATANGTSALITSLAALGVGAGDEVIVPPYTFIATINSVLMFGAMPVFVDTDPETFQIDARKIEAAITDRTRVILPAHIGGAAADVDAIMAIAARRKIPVVEDTCQSHLAEWKKRKLGTFGAAGCFSFQNSKNLNSGEGGAVITDDAGLVERSFAFHNNGRGRKNTGYDFSYTQRGANLRMTEFQAALLMAQMTRLEKQASQRDQNGAYLTSMLREIPGIVPARMYPGNTRNAYHLYMFRYQAERFAGLSRAKFLKALSAEGVHCSGGYDPLNREPFVKNTLLSRGFQKIYSKQEVAHWEERNQCPANDRLCKEAVWFTQNMLLAGRTDMEQIAAAIKRIQAHAAEIARA